MRIRLEHGSARDGEVERQRARRRQTRSGAKPSLGDRVAKSALQARAQALAAVDVDEEIETTDRLFQLEAWREAGCFTQRERAALGLTDAVTLVRDTRVPDDVWEEAAAAFDARELAALLAAIVSSNSWNRVNIAIREPAGTYQPG